MTMAAPAKTPKADVMPDPIEVRLVTSNSFPSGTGSFNYSGSYQLIVQNLAFQKQVAVRGTRAGSQVWTDHFASFQDSLPDGREVWRLTTSDELVAFAANYTVRGVTFWDNNGGANYTQPQVFDDFDALLGRVPAVVAGQLGFSDATHINVIAAVKNIAFAKQVGIVFTTDHWKNTSVAMGTFDRTLISGNEVWNITATVGAARPVEFALFYRVNGQEFWDNNLSRNYTLT
jgi:Carbohydrate/starch-binding module (family 21)